MRWRSAVIVCILLSSMFSMIPISNEESPPARAIMSAFVTHAPIHIAGNAGFLAPNSSTGVSWGSGTLSDPYVISGWDLTGGDVNGIWIEDATAYFIIRDCRIHDGANAIVFNNCANGVISHNNISSNGGGICLWWSDSIQIINCTFQDHPNDCIDIFGSNHTLMSDNYLGQSWYGISLWASCYSTLRRNALHSPLEISGYSLCHWNTNSIDISNTLNGRPIRFYRDQTGASALADAGQIILANCSDFTIAGCGIGIPSYGIQLGFSSNSTIANNDCSNGSIGIRLSFSDGNEVIGNTCNSNAYDDGIYLYFSNENSIVNNTCKSNWAGINLKESDQNILSRNYCFNGMYGLMIDSSRDNRITTMVCLDNNYCGVVISPVSSSASGNVLWNNTFIDNNGTGIQAFDGGTNNHWNSSSGYGNYWSDWRSPDQVAPFGIVDFPYNISGNAGARDYFPLAAPVADLFPPITFAAVLGTAGENGWYVSNVSVVLTAIDDVAINRTSYRIDAGDWMIYAGTIQLYLMGTYYVEYYSDDSFGNSEDVKGVFVKIDWTPPSSFAEREGNNVAISAMDYGYSGLSFTMYRIDDGPYQTYVGPFEVTGDGNHMIQYYSVDNAGNSENIQSFEMYIGTDPFLGDSLILGLLVVLLFALVIIISVVLVMRERARLNVPPPKLR